MELEEFEPYEIPEEYEEVGGMEQRVPKMVPRRVPPRRVVPAPRRIPAVPRDMIDVYAGRGVWSPKKFWRVKRTYPQEQVLLGGSRYIAKALSEAEVVRLVRDIETLMLAINGEDYQAKAIKMLLEGNVDTIVNFARVMSNRLETVYEGRISIGEGLLLDWLVPRDLGYDNYNVTATGAGWYNWYGATADRSRGFVTNEYTGVLHLGLAFVSPDPAVDAVDFNKGGKDFPEWAIRHNLAKVFVYPEPVVQLNNEQLLGKLHFIRAGTEVVIPLSIKAGLARQFRGFRTGSIEG